MNKILAIYLKMIVDGTAFENWEIKPDSKLRNEIVEYILNGKYSYNLSSLSYIRKNIINTKNMDEIKKVIDDIFIKESDFKI